MLVDDALRQAIGYKFFDSITRCDKYFAWITHRYQNQNTVVALFIANAPGFGQFGCIRGGRLTIQIGKRYYGDLCACTIIKGYQFVFQYALLISDSREILALAQ